MRDIGVCEAAASTSCRYVRGGRRGANLGCALHGQTRVWLKWPDHTWFAKRGHTWPYVAIRGHTWPYVVCPTDTICAQAPFVFRTVWAFVSAMLDERQKAKINILGGQKGERAKGGGRFWTSHRIPCPNAYTLNPSTHAPNTPPHSPTLTPPNQTLLAHPHPTQITSPSC